MTVHVHELHSGVKLKTTSEKRYVTFVILKSEPTTAHVFARTSSHVKAAANHMDAEHNSNGGYERIATVDFKSGIDNYIWKSKLIFDT